ncbi:unnamed protein product [Auanema sp. JU1783]|nr:unnamed protein product [Auanema sp. JU1783]
MSENERTCYVGNLPPDVTEELFEELFVQVGPLEKVILRNNDSNRYGLVVFTDEESVPFAIETLDGVRLFDAAITVKPRNGSQQEILYKKRLDKSRDDPHKRRSCPDIPSLNQIDMGRFNPLAFAGLPPPPQPPYGTPPMSRRDDHPRDTWHTPPPNRNDMNGRYSGGSGSNRRSEPRPTFPYKNERSNERGRDREYYRADYDYDRREPRDYRDRDRDRSRQPRRSYERRY